MYVFILAHGLNKENLNLNQVTLSKLCNLLDETWQIIMVSTEQD